MRNIKQKVFTTMLALIGALIFTGCSTKTEKYVGEEKVTYSTNPFVNSNYKLIVKQKDGTRFKYIEKSGDDNALNPFASWDQSVEQKLDVLEIISPDQNMRKYKAKSGDLEEKELMNKANEKAKWYIEMMEKDSIPNLRKNQLRKDMKYFK